MKFTTASGGAIVLACTPAMTLLLGHLTGSEKWSLRKGLGVVCAFLGAATAIGYHRIRFCHDNVAWRRSDDPRDSARCSLRHLLQALSEKIFSSDGDRDRDGCGRAWAVGFLGGDRLPHGLSPSSARGEWVSILYIGICGGALSFFLYAWALGQTAPTTTMILLPLNPIAAARGGAIFLHEKLSISLSLGLALVVVGIVLVVGGESGTAQSMHQGRCHEGSFCSATSTCSRLSAPFGRGTSRPVHITAWWLIFRPPNRPRPRRT